MINISELRIGNIVGFKIVGKTHIATGSGPIDSITKQWVTLNGIRFHLKYLCRIELSIEILEKLGFQQSINSETFGNKIIGIHFDNHGFDYQSFSGKYLHQFQNVYYTKTGKDIDTSKLMAARMADSQPA